MALQRLATPRPSGGRPGSHLPQPVADKRSQGGGTGWGHGPHPLTSSQEFVTPHHLTPEQVQRDLTVRDLTDPHAGPHAIQILIRRAVEALADRWPCQVRWWRGERIVTVEDNYDHLGFGAAAVTRDARHTR